MRAPPDPCGRGQDIGVRKGAERRPFSPFPLLEEQLLCPSLSDFDAQSDKNVSRETFL